MAKLIFSSFELMNIKDKILEASLTLFNSEGIEKVTTRHIASSIGISQGNLHYHYPNKNALINALYASFLENIKQAETYSGKTIFTPEEVFNSTRNNFEVMFEYRFLFKDNEVVWRRLPELKQGLVNLLTQKRLAILELINDYRSRNLFRADINEAQCTHLADHFIFVISTWLNAAEYIHYSGNAAVHYARFTFQTWLPYLNEGEMERWESIVIV